MGIFAKRRKVCNAKGEFLYECIMTWCPGCNLPHPFTIVAVRSETWEWDGDLEEPTFSPSYLTWAGPRENPIWLCHSFLRKGVWSFLSDSTHSLAGKDVPMIGLPDWLVNE